MNLLKQRDSELWFVENELHTISIGQTTHQDLVKKSCLRHILFDKTFLRCIFFHTKSGLQRMIFTQHFLLNHAEMHLISSFLFCPPISLRWKWLELQYRVTTRTHFVPNSNQESVRSQTLCRNKPLEIHYYDYILLRFHFVSSHLLLNLWHSNDPEPKVQATYISLPTQIFVHSRACWRLRANTSRRIKQSSGWYHPRRYRPQRFCTATVGCTCTPNAPYSSASADFNQTRWREVLLLT